MARGVTKPAAPDAATVIEHAEDADLEVTIFDVGHGNCALVRDGRNCAIVDAAPGDAVLDELERVNCEHIEHLIISHSDKDHAGGGPTLLLDDARTIGTVWFNADGEKGSEIWNRLLRAVWTRKRKGGLEGHQSIHTEISQTLTCGRAVLEVAHPSILLAGTGPTGRSSAYGRLTTNAVSVVIRVHLAERPAVLLAADMDRTALDHIRENGKVLNAPVLVFPHHGGLPGNADPYEFAVELSELIQPELVIFSIKSSRRPANPDPRIVAGVRQGAPDAHIACTQLSVHCHGNTSPGSGSHLAARVASGKPLGRCCAGTITVGWEPDKLVFDPPLAQHRLFVETRVGKPLCRAQPLLPEPRRPRT
ncbi:ComEC/Rec2 family competence protein [Actinoallomurus soli]|uniref:ComEC/Rec2 family competence protein n=1 Tax=Actinoallomurus soli TaxID=2952535 RepID=UPI00387332E7